MTDGVNLERPRAPVRRVRRRQLLTFGLGGAAVALGIGAVGYNLYEANLAHVRLGITAGSQTLWRYVAQRKVDLLGSLGYDTTFSVYPDEVALRAAFVGGTIDVMASLVPAVASLADAGIAARVFLPLAWLH